MNIKNSSVSALFLALIATTAFGSPYEPLAKWDKKSIRICWGENEHASKTYFKTRSQDYNFSAFTDAEKSAIKEVINREYNLKTVGIEFTGWEDCSKNIDVDVVIFRENLTAPADKESFEMRGGHSITGQNGVLNSLTDDKGKDLNVFVRSGGYLPVITINVSSSITRVVKYSEYLKYVALHEFGHTVGLTHEHRRYQDALNDPNCKISKVTLKEEFNYDSTRYIGPYDYNSVMNYCFINAVISSTGLTFNQKKWDSKLKLTDPTIYTWKEVLTWPFKLKRLEVQLEARLSQQDKEAVRCMYYYEGEDKIKKCPKEISIDIMYVENNEGPIQGP